MRIEGPSNPSAPGDVRPLATIAGHHVAAAERAAPTGMLEEWAADAWADAAWDFVEPLDALGSAVRKAVMVFEDGSCLLLRCGDMPREVTLATGLAELGCLNAATVGRLLRSRFGPIRMCALGLVADLPSPLAGCPSKIDLSQSPPHTGHGPSGG